MRKGQQSAKEKGHRRVWKAEPTKRPHTPERVELPKRMHLPRMPTPAMPPHVGRWLWTCRAGFEAQLFEELGWARLEPSLLAPALCSSLAPGAFVPAFARMGFLVDAVVTSAAGAHEALPLEPTKVQVWAPDTDAGNSLSSDCTGWEAVISGLRTGAVVDPATPWKAYEAGAWLGQVCLASRGVAAVGRVRAREAASLSAGGRTHEAHRRRALTRRDEARRGARVGTASLRARATSASTSARRPAGGPGGFSSVAPACGASTPACSPPTSRSTPRCATSTRARSPSCPTSLSTGSSATWRGARSRSRSCWAKWARNRWATQLVANIKLPMKDKLPWWFGCAPRSSPAAGRTCAAPAVP
jgi:23S rRNA (cytidine2498-2'-O)-methyltransferase